VLILGHFHRFGNWKFRNRHILNTGAWFRHATPYYVDMRDGQVLAYKKISTATDSV
jgi:UDP-2,3-diacylglucosamine pyrophosphatase LpxH